MSISHRSPIRPLAAVLLGASLILAACGGSSDSSSGNRNRNSSFIMENCYQTQDDKDNALKAAEHDYELAEEYSKEADELKKEYEDALKEYYKALSSSDDGGDENGGDENNIQNAAFQKPATTTTTVQATTTSVKMNGAGNGNGNGNDTSNNENSSKLTKIKEAKDKADAAFAKYDAAKKRAQFKDSFKAHVDMVKERPICQDEITPVTQTMPEETTTTTEDGGAGAADVSTTIANGDGTTSTVEMASTTMPEADVTTTSDNATATTMEETTTSVEETTTTVEESTTTTSVNETQDPLPPAEKLTCSAPVLDDGNTYEVTLGGTVSLSHAPCIDTRAKAAISGDPQTMFSSQMTDPQVIWDVTPPTAGTLLVQVFFIDPGTLERVSPVTEATITVTEKSDPCDGKAPTIDENPAGSNIFDAAATCDEAEFLQTWFLNDQGVVFHLSTWGRSFAGYSLDPLEEGFGRVASIVIWHVADNKLVGNPTKWIRPQDTTTTVEEATTTSEASGSGDTTTTVEDATTTTSGATATTSAEATTTTVADSPTTTPGAGDSATGTTTTSVAPEDTSVVKALPVTIMVEEVIPGKPAVIVAAPSSLVGLSCDTACVSAASGFAPAEISLTEISLDGGDWQSVTSGFIAPVSYGGTTVRLRVTPQTGTAKVLSTRIVAGKIDLVAEGIAKGAPANSYSIGDGSGTKSTSSSFPWWIVIVVIAILLLFFFIRRRKDDDEGTQTPATA